MTLEQALLWMNDRRGKTVRAELQVRVADHNATVASLEGEVVHWRDSPATSDWGGDRRDDIAGLYQLGEEGTLDFTEMAERCTFGTVADERELHVGFADGVRLVIFAEDEFADAGGAS